MAKSATRSQKAGHATTLAPKMDRVLASFGKLGLAERRQFVNAVTAETDYFRKPRKTNGAYKDVPDASITPARVQMSVRMRNNPIKGLTFDKLTNYLDLWRQGFYRQPGMAWDLMERRDYQIQIVRPKRLKSVARHGYDILTIEGDGSQKALADQQKEFLKGFYDNLTATTALNPDEEGGFSLLVRQMMDAIGKYYSVHEIVWQPGIGQSGSDLTAKFIHCPIWWFEGTKGKLRFLPSEFQVYGNEMVDGEWLVTCGDGLMEACSVLYLMKWLPFRSWITFLDKFGMPGIQGKTDAQKGTKEWNDFVEAVQEFGEEWATVTNRNAEICLVEAAKASGDGGYDKIIEKIDRAITQLWRGADLGTTGSKDATGASLQGDESEILETDDAKLIEETLTNKVSRFALAWKFGPDTPQLAYLKLRTTPRQNIQDDVLVDTFLSGFPDMLGKEATLERYGRPVPKAGEETLNAPAPVAPGAIPPGGTKPKSEDPAFANEALTQDVGAALHEMILPLLKRLEAIAQIDDVAIQRHLIEKLLRDFPSIAAAIHADGSLAKKLSPTLEHALLGGAHKETGFANGDVPGHDFHGNQYSAAVSSIKDVMSGKSQEAAYAKVSPEMAAKIKAATGQDVSGHQHFIDREALTHIDRQHGVGKEKQEGHEPVTKDDIEKIPLIVHTADKVTDGGKSARGLPTVKYAKRFNGTTYYVEEEWAKEKVLAAKTMYKIKAPGNSATPKGGVSHTSKTSGAKGT